MPRDPAYRPPPALPAGRRQAGGGCHGGRHIREPPWAVRWAQNRAESVLENGRCNRRVPGAYQPFRCAAPVPTPKTLADCRRYAGKVKGAVLQTAVICALSCEDTSAIPELHQIFARRSLREAALSHNGSLHATLVSPRTMAWFTAWPCFRSRPLLLSFPGAASRAHWQSTTGECVQLTCWRAWGVRAGWTHRRTKEESDSGVLELSRSTSPVLMAVTCDH